MMDSSVISRRGPNLFSRAARDKAEDVGSLVLGAGKLSMVVPDKSSFSLLNMVW